MRRGDGVGRWAFVLVSAVLLWALGVCFAWIVFLGVEIFGLAAEPEVVSVEELTVAEAHEEIYRALRDEGAVVKIETNNPGGSRRGTESPLRPEKGGDSGA